MPKSSC